MNLFHSSFVSGVLALGIFAATVSAAPPPVDDRSGIAQLNSTLLTPGAYAMTAVNDGLRYRSEGVSSSSDAVDEEIASLAAGTSAEGSGAGQYGSRRRRSYGRSRYEDRMHNADGSTKIAFVAGAGLNLPVGNTGKFYTPSYGLVAGAGLNLNRQFGLLAEFHYDHAGLTGGAINYEFARLASIIVSQGGSASDLNGLDANSHMFAFTLNPVISFADPHRSFGAYVTGGVGYYHKSTNFTLPSVGTACNSYYCYYYQANYNLTTDTANSFGANGGLGLTYRLSEFSSERLFIEARYHWLKIDGANASGDFFPFNRRNSEYVPIIAGIRF